jgi:hypothetical protein
MPAPPNFPDSPLTSFVRGLMATPALAGVDVIPGAAGLARQTAPWRVVIFPHDGSIARPSDASVSIADDNQQLLVELWGKGSSSGNAADATFADWNACWALLQRFLQALAEQGENPTNPDSPGAFWEVVDGPGWDTKPDTNQQGMAIRLLVSACLPISAASDDVGHTGDNWPQGTATGVAINGTPGAP